MKKENKKINKNVIIVFAALIILIILAKAHVFHSIAYFSSESQAWKKHGEERAREYVIGKYGQEPKVISSKLLGEAKRWKVFGECYGDVAVKMEMNGKKFTVLICGNDDRPYENVYINAGNLPDSYGIRDGADDYQNDEIKAAIIKALNDKGISEIDGLYLQYGEIYYKNGAYKNFSSKYFDGSNFEEALKSIDVYYDRYRFNAYTHESDLSNINVNELTNEFGATNFRVSNFKTDFWKNKFFNESINTDVVDQADELIDCIICSNGFPYYYNFTKHGYMDIQYYALGGTYCNVTKLEESDYPESMRKHYLLTDLYEFDTDAHIIIVYFPTPANKENGPVYVAFKSTSTKKEFLTNCLDVKTPKGYTGGYIELVDRNSAVFGRFR